MEKIIGTCAILLIIIGIGYTQSVSPAVNAAPKPTASSTPAGRTGAWQGTLQNDSVCMSLVSRTPQSSWMNGACFAVSEFSALPVSDADFSITRPAGTLTLRGKFEGAEGYGRFFFTSNRTFADWLSGQGITGLDEDAMMFLFFANTGKEYVEFIKKAGYGNITGQELHQLALLEVSQQDIQAFQALNNDLGNNDVLPVDELLNLKIHGLDREFIKAVQEAGFSDLTLEQLLQAKVHNLSPDFIRQCRELGFGKTGFEEVLACKIHEITPAFVRECRDMGYPDLSLDEVMNFKIHEITPDFIRQCRDMGFPNLSADEVMNLKIHGITPAFLGEMKQLGFHNLGPDEAVSLKIHEIDQEFVKEMAGAGFKNLSIDEVISCRIHGVNARIVREFNNIGFPKVTVDEAVSLAIHEVTPGFIQEMREKGFNNLSLEEYIQLKVQFVKDRQ